MYQTLYLISSDFIDPVIGFPRTPGVGTGDFYHNIGVRSNPESPGYKESSNQGTKYHHRPIINPFSIKLFFLLVKTNVG
jgi:hypothetical protein